MENTTSVTVPQSWDKYPLVSREILSPPNHEACISWSNISVLDASNYIATKNLTLKAMANVTCGDQTNKQYSYEIHLEAPEHPELNLLLTNGKKTPFLLQKTAF